MNEWNSFLEQVPSYYKGELKALPVLRSAESGERFGLLVASASAFPVIKTEDSEFTGIEYAAPLTIEESIREDITSGLQLGSEQFRVALADTDALPAALQIQEGESADLHGSFVLLTVMSSGGSTELLAKRLGKRRELSPEPAPAFSVATPESSKRPRKETSMIDITGEDDVMELNLVSLFASVQSHKLTSLRCRAFR